jgi:hypothetical protein
MDLNLNFNDQIGKIWQILPFGYYGINIIIHKLALLLLRRII